VDVDVAPERIYKAAPVHAGAAFMVGRVGRR
jgi:hypothetical protein